MGSHGVRLTVTVWAVLCVGCSSAAPTASDCVEAWNSSNGPVLAVEALGSALAGSDVKVRTWSGAEDNSGAPGCSVIIDAGSSGGVLGSRYADDAMQARILEAGAELEAVAAHPSQADMEVSAEGVISIASNS